jgi:hypothetical protein
MGMNRDDIIRMAQEACGEPAWSGGVEWTWEEVERFAHLVAAAEREACAKVCDKIADEDGFEGGYADRCAFAIRERGAP